MGLTDIVPGLSGSSDSPEEPTTAHRVILVDPEPWEKDRLDEYRLMLGPDIKNDEWSVYDCTEQTYVPEDSHLYIFEVGDIVSVNGAVQTCLAQILPEEDVDRDEYDGTFIEFPDHLTGETIPKMTAVSEEELKMFYLSVSDLQ